MINYSDYAADSRNWEERVCAILCRYPEKYGSRMPYPIEEADFTRQDCLNVFRAFCQLRSSGEPFNHIDVYIRLCEELHSPEGNISPEFTERDIVMTPIEDDIRVSFYFRIVRMVGLNRRLTQNAYPNDEARLAEQQELDGIGAEIEAARKRVVEEAKELERQRQLLRQANAMRRNALTCVPNEHPFLPVLKHMNNAVQSGERRSSFRSYAEIHALFQQMLGCDPLRSSQELRKLMNKDFLDYLMDTEGIQILFHRRSAGKRGLRLEPAVPKQEMEDQKLAQLFLIVSGKTCEAQLQGNASAYQGELSRLRC